MRGHEMRRTSRVVLTVVLLLTAGAAPARTQATQGSQAPPPAPVPSPQPDRLEEFVPNERVKADSAVAMPVDL